MSKDNDIESKCSSIIMKLLYLSNALIPSRQANSIHIMKICSAFSKIGFKVSLTFRKNTQDNLYTDDNEIFEFYGIKSTFKLISLQKNNSLFSIYIISPFSTSLINLAPIISRAHVSDART